MKRVLAIVFLLIIGFGAWWLFFKTDKSSDAEINDTPATPLAVKKHSPEFNQKISKVLNAYFLMKDSFVEADTIGVKTHATSFIGELDSLQLDELQNDAPELLAAATQQISDMKANASPIIKETDLTQMRQDFRMVSENLYPFLRTIGYEGDKLYWQNCPMAFGEQEANWVSNTREILNPYLGKNHPEYKSTMLHCGENQDSIFVK